MARRTEWLEDDKFLDAIPPAFSRLASLTRLMLGGQCRIQRGWQHLQPLSQLQRLDLSRMRLTRMPHGLTALWDLPLLRIEVDADDTAHGWVKQFNERNADLLEQHRQQQERATAWQQEHVTAWQQEPATDWLRSFWLVLLRLLRRLFGGPATE